MTEAKREPAQRYWNLVDLIEQACSQVHVDLDRLSKPDLPLISRSILEGAYFLDDRLLDDNTKALARQISMFPVSKWRLGRVWNLVEQRRDK